MNRSKYRNPDMPVGYVKNESELKCKEGIEIDGEHFIWAPFIYDLHLDEREDYASLGDFIIMSDDDDNIEDTEAGCTKSPSNIEIEVEESVAKESVAKESAVKENAVKENATKGNAAKEKNPELEKEKIPVKKTIKTEKKDPADLDSNLDASLSCMDIDPANKEKRKKVKKERKTDLSDSSSPSSRKHKDKKSIVTYSPSPSPEHYMDIKIKEESLDQPQHLFGSYYCEVCNITMNSLLTYETHVNGKRHRKNMKVRNVSEVAALSIPATAVSEDQSKYPEPRPGIIRKRSHTTSKIQHIIEREVKKPCPGLNRVIEIQGIEGVQYYCAMCDSVCSSNSIIPHITGFKHQLKSVKEFKPSAYEYMSNEPKFKIERELVSLLRAVQKTEGMGKIIVEVEELASTQDKYSGSQSSTSKDHRSQPSTSRGMSIEYTTTTISISERHLTAHLPDQTASDFFCETCQSHMNSLQMWEAHIRGKRHLTNVKKMPGDLPSKTKTILLPNKRAFILDRLRQECPDEPVVGLKEVRETEVPETNSHSYQCFLCGSCHTSLDIVEHLVSLKHRTKYLEHIDFPGREVYFGMSDMAAYSLVREMCAKVEATEGRGKPAVHISKSAIYR